MSPKKGRRQLKATGPSPKKLVLRDKAQAFADDAESGKERSLDGSTSASSPSSKLLEDTRQMRESLAPSPSPSLAASSAEPSSPSKRRILSGTLPSSPKKSKSSSDEGSFTEHLTGLNIRSDSPVSSVNLDETSKSQDKTPKTKDKTTFNIDGQMGSPRNKDVGGHNLRLPLEEDAVSPVQHSEDIELPTTPRSKNSMDVDENTSDLSEFDEVPDDLVKVAQDLVTSKAEEHIAKIFNDRFAPQQAQIDQIREDVRQIGQLYNGPCLGDLEAFEAAAWFISRHLLTDREETFRCLAAHPYYQQTKQVQLKIKQELVFFFDRRFTYQMGKFYGLDIPVDVALLHLGCDGAFRQGDSLDCGVLDEMAIMEDNVETWASLITPIIHKDEGITGIEMNTEEQFHQRLLRVLPSLSSKEADDSKSAGSEFQEGQYNDTLQQALTPKATVKRASRVTQSEILEYKMLTGRTLGEKALEAQVVQRTGPEGPRTPDYEADTSDTEDDASGKNGADSEMMDTSEMEAAVPPFLHAGYFQDHVPLE